MFLHCARARPLIRELPLARGFELSLARGFRCTSRRLCENAAASAASQKPPADHKAADEKALNFLAERGSSLGIRLSLRERQLIIEAADTDGDGKMSNEEWDRLVSRHAMASNERLTLAQFILRSIDQQHGQQLLRVTARVGATFFAVTGANVAGECGMHVFGATLVGCITGLAGGTINSLLIGSTVGWTRDPALLAYCMAACVAGFYLWPLADRLMQPEGGSGAPPGSDSVVRYSIESVALGAAAVVAAQQGIVQGLHPLISLCLGVTIAFGGAGRDLLCGREVRLNHMSGSQSYAVAAFSGAGVYVLLRELHVWNCSGSSVKLVTGGVPIGLRIAMGVGTSVAIRAYAWWRRPDDLFWSMDAAATANEEWLSRLLRSQ
ncbi:hypothetical protein EMIHUDRAFT_207163 [Emiliania huxleyi CCMP1516]|uniref:EF-hand domain-containing protein n=2 Tax=Emiliania huxleyi TaxID=2903 RepID=A0A0D3JKP2_EMIH1|nr:hypothetical protein EMIHUDRAFT_207163 [Emiliania huxleyi CCMP1516]EOD24077.1 hypothetical protein EMIHUDRAFT_207163 [Emiliania huxleyi CCMP1516]|eukprot:XP_005776506.1 hypothetical protein EMIHUDRAFT_207163 [Emiliania huxleyi CCMP1516]